MHGRKRETLEASLARREATLPKVKLICALQDDAIRRRTERRYDAESMAVTGRLLEINPEVFTAWNFRREAIVRLAERANARRRATVTAQQSAAAAPAAAAEGLSLPSSLAEDDKGSGEEDASSLDGVSREASATARVEEVEDEEEKAPFIPLLRDELALTERTLRKNPKSYPSWHHRKWTVRRLVEQARARAAASAAADDAEDADEKILLTREMELCAALLELDDRNFHCWGYRRFVVNLRGAPDAEELEYTTRKIETNFSNYSAWHHRSTYLPRVHGQVQTAAAAAAAQTTPSEDASEKTKSKRRAALGRLPKDVLDAEYELVQQAFFTEPEDQSGWMYHRWLLGKTLGAQQLRVFGDDDDDDDDSKFSYDDEQRGPAEEVVEILEREADLCRQLMEMEPDSKWPVVTLARLCRAKGSADQASQEESVGSFRRLVSLDPMRAGYYCDCCR